METQIGDYTRDDRNILDIWRYEPESSIAILPTVQWIEDGRVVGSIVHCVAGPAHPDKIQRTEKI
jgi:hypothetical protein